VSASDGRKLYRTWARFAERRGWTITMTGSGHLRWRSPLGVLVFTAGTPGEGRAIANARAQLRRAGLMI
jgi:hypothetical protein